MTVWKIHPPKTISTYWGTAGLQFSKVDAETSQNSPAEAQAGTSSVWESTVFSGVRGGAFCKLPAYSASSRCDVFAAITDQKSAISMRQEDKDRCEWAATSGHASTVCLEAQQCGSAECTIEIPGYGPAPLNGPCCCNLPSLTSSHKAEVVQTEWTVIMYFTGQEDKVFYLTLTGAKTKPPLL